MKFRHVLMSFAMVTTVLLSGCGKDAATQAAASVGAVDLTKMRLDEVAKDHKLYLVVDKDIEIPRESAISPYYSATLGDDLFNVQRTSINGVFDTSPVPTASVVLKTGRYLILTALFRDVGIYHNFQVKIPADNAMQAVFPNAQLIIGLKKATPALTAFTAEAINAACKFSIAIE